MRTAARTLLATWAIGVLLAAGPAAAQDGGRPPYSDGDWARLPEWCIDSQDGPYGPPAYGPGVPVVGRNGSPRSDRWTNIFGADFWHMHHYCRALWADFRAVMPVAGPQLRIALIERSLIDYSYVIRHSSENMILMPEIHYRRGEAFLRLGDRIKAGESFAEARRLKPDYWPAYARWAEELITLRLFDSAEELLAAGLRQVPEQPKLLALKEHLASARTGPRR
jgi:hypothetical protein